MARQQLAQLDREDFTRFQIANAKRAAIAVNPAAYSATETEQVLLAFARLMSDLIARYNLDDALDWEVSEYTGLIWVGEP